MANCLLGNEEESARRVGRMLYPYTRDGSYGRYFEGASNTDQDNPFVVLELGELDTKPDLQTVVLLLLMMRITEAMYLGDRNQRKLCIIDEAWRLMGQGNAGQFIEQGYRTARKYGGAFMTITQGIDDYFKSGTSKAALDNADWVFLLRQKPESIKAAENSDRIMMDEALRRLLTSVDTQQGKYSEIAVMGPGGTTVGRLVVDPFAEKLYSTRAEEYAAIEAMQRQGLSLVIEQRLKALEESGELARIEEDAKARYRAYVERPKGVHLPRAKKNRTYYVDPSLTVPYDIRDHEGSIIYPAGTTVNPLDYITLSKQLLFFDGDDPLQIEWARTILGKYSGQIIPILTNGPALTLMKDWEIRLYFDQHGRLAERFGIKSVPALVSQDKKQLKVDEISIIISSR